MQLVLKTKQWKKNKYWVCTTIFMDLFSYLHDVFLICSWVFDPSHCLLVSEIYNIPGGGEGRGVLGLTFAGYVPLDFQNPFPIIVYSVANYRPHLSQFWANM